MTETSDFDSLPPAIRRFVLHWGDMGGTWGVNRSVAQIHALLLLSERPQAAEEISTRLGIARSNVSTSLKELQSWQLIRRVPVAGDRRDHFEAEGDVWEIARRIAAGRKLREIDPAAEVLRLCHAEAADDPGTSAHARAKIAEMQDFVATLDSWYDRLMALPKSRLASLARLGGRAIEILSPFLSDKRK